MRNRIRVNHASCRSAWTNFGQRTAIAPLPRNTGDPERSIDKSRRPTIASIGAASFEHRRSRTAPCSGWRSWRQRHDDFGSVIQFDQSVWLAGRRPGGRRSPRNRLQGSEAAGSRPVPSSRRAPRSDSQETRSGAPMPSKNTTSARLLDMGAGPERRCAVPLHRSRAGRTLRATSFAQSPRATGSSATEYEPLHPRGASPPSSRRSSWK